MHTLPTPGRLDKHFEKLDLSGGQAWTDQERQEIRNLLTEYHDLFALGDLELGKTSLVKHSIKLTNDNPFKERYKKIPLHQYKEVKKLQRKVLKNTSTPIRRSQEAFERDGKRLELFRNQLVHGYGSGVGEEKGWLTQVLY